MKSSRVWKVEWVKDFVQRLRMKGSNSLGSGTGQRCCSKTWEEGFKEFRKENGSKIFFKDLA